MRQVHPTCGTFHAFGEEISERSLRNETRASLFRTRVGFVFQNPDAQLFSSVPVLKSIINSPEFAKNKDGLGAAKYYQPIAKTLASPGGSAVFRSVVVS